MQQEAEAVRGGPPVPYEVMIEGPMDPELAGFLRAASEAEAARDRPPTSLLALRRRAKTDAERLTAALASEGYYDGRVEASVQEPEDDRPAKVNLAVTPGDRYRVAAVAVETVGDDRTAFVPPSPADLGLLTGAPARADDVLGAEARLLERAQEAGHAHAVLADRDAIIDRATRTMDVVLRLDPGPVVHLAAPTFVGLEGIDARFVGQRVAWAPGDRFSPDDLRETRRRLIDTNLFRTVDVQVAEAPGADGTTPVTIAVQQRLHRTIGAGVRVDTDGGPGVNLSWEHRNFLGAGERFRAEVDADLLVQRLSARFRKPDALGPESALLAEADFERQDTDAFDSLEIGAATGVEYRFSERVDGTTALRLSLSEITDAAGTETFALVSLPTAVRYDDTDSLLDPSRGRRLRAEITPFQDLSDADLRFGRLRLDGSTYVRLRQEPRLVLALRGAIGSIVGAERDDVPANERFYAGGGGSIRGIPFQTASPLDDRDDPLGGRSLVELSAEVRYGITETIGAVAFVDAGRAFESSFPDFDERLEIGAGVGLRYGTPIGPLRLDVAVPVDRRDVDDAFQVYVGLGQAF